MIAIDTSAIIAILTDEPERRQFNEIIGATQACYISVANLLETRIVLYSRAGENATLALDSYLLKSNIKPVETTAIMGDLAFSAYRRFGKGTGHPASLNYGDCFSYALAMNKNIPLLFKGNDFSQTDILSVVKRH
ncbi:type II toxin-antitoxin system VapC family toxin [Kiloniella sp.]|uniref:type II toxin-antitoxin system VapC family toxin n=1 Tax=Kiloniella sp. TaxID=1938587 RepID=UPI003B017577